ncbi:hypothetical protein HOD19_02580 [bacterium]|jgi:thymidylate kinase|nr:hypothetical protein [bacterium]MBT4649068.1 hypothetical protein [bacterium]
MSHKIIFEGAELTGKSWLMSQVYDHIEPKYNSGNKILDGCHWFNCDVGIFGTKYGQVALQKYLELTEELKEANVMLEKFHLSEAVYQKLYNNQNFLPAGRQGDFSAIENRLQKLNTKIILVTFPEDEKIIQARLQDRLNLYPHYEKIAQAPTDYIKQQRLFKELIKQSKLEYLIIETNKLPDESLVDKILQFIGEK